MSIGKTTDETAEPCMLKPLQRRGRPPKGALSTNVAAAAEHRVEAVERALSILDAFVDNEPSLTLAAIARRTGFNPSTILRLSASLMRFGYLRRLADGRYCLGPKPLQLGTLYRNQFDLAHYIRPALAGLAAATEETAAFYVRDGDVRICLFRHQADTSIRHHVEEGARLPMGKGASAHVLAAFAEGARDGAAIRQLGYAVSLGERDPESAAIAAPVFGPNGELVGALGIAALLSRLMRKDQAQLIRLVTAAANGVTAALGGQRAVGGLQAAHPTGVLNIDD
jgi:DNA-binding IclR family transcriptional regulator